MLGLPRSHRHQWLSSGASGLVLYLVLAFLLAIVVGSRRFWRHYRPRRVVLPNGVPFTIFERVAGP